MLDFETAFIISYFNHEFHFKAGPGSQQQQQQQQVAATQGPQTTATGEALLLHDTTSAPKNTIGM